MRRWGPADYRDMPWKNGGGVTRELLRRPHPTRPEGFGVRLSIATVAAAGPFSLFPGVDRHLLLLEGQGMALTRAGASEEVVVAPGQPLFSFPGEDAWDCRLLGGPVRDFNVMVDRALAEASLERVHLGAGAGHRLAASPGTLWLYGVSGRVQVAGEVLAEEDILEWDMPGALELVGESEATVLLIRLMPRAGR